MSSAFKSISEPRPQKTSPLLDCPYLQDLRGFGFTSHLCRRASGWLEERTRILTVRWVRLSPEVPDTSGLPLVSLFVLLPLPDTLVCLVTLDWGLASFSSHRVRKHTVLWLFEKSQDSHREPIHRARSWSIFGYSVCFL